MNFVFHLRGSIPLIFKRGNENIKVTKSNQRIREKANRDDIISRTRLNFNEIKNEKGEDEVYVPQRKIPRPSRILLPIRIEIRGNTP
jgi:hypothetical protein